MNNNIKKSWVTFTDVIANYWERSLEMIGVILRPKGQARSLETKNVKKSFVVHIFVKSESIIDLHQTKIKISSRQSTRVSSNTIHQRKCSVLTAFVCLSVSHIPNILFLHSTLESDRNVRPY